MAAKTTKALAPRFVLAAQASAFVITLSGCTINPTAVTATDPSDTITFYNPDALAVYQVVWDKLTGSPLAQNTGPTLTVPPGRSPNTLLPNVLNNSAYKYSLQKQQANGKFAACNPPAAGEIDINFS